jgi:transcriptional regulator
MYIPKRFEEKDQPAILDFVRANSFGVLVSVSEGRAVGTHIPLLLSEDEKGEPCLLGHISKGNDQKESLKDGAAVLAIFTGPHAYISPRWYTQLNVPTWNYIAVHAYGTIELMEGEALRAALSLMVDHYEQGRPDPMKMEEIPEKILHDDIRGIVGFRVRVTEWQAAAKLSQNRDEVSYHQVITELEHSGDAAAGAVAEAMKRANPHKKKPGGAPTGGGQE